MVLIAFSKHYLVSVSDFAIMEERFEDHRSSLEKRDNEIDLDD